MKNCMINDMVDEISMTRCNGESILPFCDCEFPQCFTVATNRGYSPDMAKCRCGEEKCLEWSWGKTNGDQDMKKIGQDIVFHPTYSQGTAIVCGERQLDVGMVHFFEIRIITQLVGTDVMIGIGTDRFDIDEFRHSYKSALGSNTESWGYSYFGRKQFNSTKEIYGKSYTQGCVIGVLVDRINGYLEFFVNRESCGIAYKNIPLDPNVKLYPMVSVTATHTVVRLMNTISVPDSLQYRSYKALTRAPKQLELLQSMPGMKILNRQFWFISPPKSTLLNTANPNNLDIADEAVLSLSRLSRKQKYPLDDDADIDDIYSNAHKITVRNRRENPDEDREDIDEIIDFILGI